MSERADTNERLIVGAVIAGGTASLVNYGLIRAFDVGGNDTIAHIAIAGLSGGIGFLLGRLIVSRLSSQ